MMVLSSKFSATSACVHISYLFIRRIQVQAFQPTETAVHKAFLMNEEKRKA